MRSKTRRIAAAVTATAGALALAGTVAATSASASPTPNAPDRFHGPQACAWKLNGVNVLDLTYNGNHYQYPVRLHVARDGAVFGTLYDQYLAAEGTAGGDPSGILRVAGDCDGNNITLDTLYPSVDPQGLRGVTMTATPTDPWHATVAGAWIDTGDFAAGGYGAAKLIFPVHAAH